MIDLDQLIREIEFAKAHGKPLIAIAGSRTALDKLAKLVPSDFGWVQIYTIDHPERFGISHDELIQVNSQAELYAINRLDSMDQAQIDIFQLDPRVLFKIFKNSFESQSSRQFPPEVPLPPFKQFRFSP